jgi:hypothetical protein
VFFAIGKYIKAGGNMPAGFLKCVKNGGRVRTKNLGNGKYIHICFIGGKSYAGEPKTRKGVKLGGK